MLPRKTRRCLSLLGLLAAALLTSSCENATVGVGLGVTAASPWGPVGVVGPTATWGWYGGGARWYP
ncbi:hypothetical protein HPC49_17220 [Pyxidicoccus fallax]|uniref:Lipoprotein n=1 Tax=Pyxidicoccus fallax TaxID=394095 RepID=A0A848LFZ3_9BACT|nr:hypothetical protein [Pyxidicoccus fallax]NMO15965.1 hypothetical protein [Pyxidicoccus fallax]NPC79955.1 hypothetical protein [Pyxidicoccus fallax]